MSGVNRDALVGHQPGQHTSTNMLCLRGLAIYILWSACRTASYLQHLTASFDSFVGTWGSPARLSE